MPNNEFFTGGTGYEDFPLFGFGSIKADDHPLSEGPYTLEPGTEYIVVSAYLGDSARTTPENTDGRTFWENSSAAAKAQGPILTLAEYEDVLRNEGTDSLGRTVPLAATGWVDRDPEPKIYSPGLHKVSHVQVPADPNDHQIRAITTSRRYPPQDIPHYAGTKFAEELQGRGFAPDSFPHFKKGAEFQAMGDTLFVPGSPLQRIVTENPFFKDNPILSTLLGSGGFLEALKQTAKPLAEEIARSQVPDRQLTSVIRTSRHTPRP